MIAQSRKREAELLNKRKFFVLQLLESLAFCSLFCVGLICFWKGIGFAQKVECLEMFT